MMGKGKEKELSPTEKLCEVTSKKDCPERVASNAAGGLVLGLFGGIVYKVVAGIARNNSIEATAQGTLRRAPVIAVSCGIVLAFYSALECLVERMRGQRDTVNCVLAGAATGALLGPGDSSLVVPTPVRSSECYGGGSTGFTGPVLSKVPPRLANALLGAILFGVVDGVLRSELCDKKSKTGDKKTAKK